MLDRFRTKYYEVIVRISKEIEVLTKYLTSNSSVLARNHLVDL